MRKRIHLNSASTLTSFGNFKLLICKIRRPVLGFKNGRGEWGIVLPSSNSEKKWSPIWSVETSFCQKSYGWESIWLISQREICKPVFKLDFTAHGIMASLSAFAWTVFSWRGLVNSFQIIVTQLKTVAMLICMVINIVPISACIVNPSVERDMYKDLPF